MRHLPTSHRGGDRRVAIVLSRFNPQVGDGLLRGALRALSEAGVGDDRIVIASVPGALETPLALQRLAQGRKFDALIALGAVIRGDTYHFEIVANESARGLMDVMLECGMPIANGILTTDDEKQAQTRLDKGAEAVRVAVEMARLKGKIGEA